MIPMATVCRYSTCPRPVSSAHNLPAATRICWRSQMTASSCTPGSMGQAQSSALPWLHLAHRTFVIPFQRFLSEGLQQRWIFRSLRERHTQRRLCLELRTVARLVNRSASLMTLRHALRRDLPSPHWHGELMPTHSLRKVLPVTCLRFQSRRVVLCRPTHFPVSWDLAKSISTAPRNACIRKAVRLLTPPPAHLLESSRAPAPWCRTLPPTLLILPASKTARR